MYATQSTHNLFLYGISIFYFDVKKIKFATPHSPVPPHPQRSENNMNFVIQQHFSPPTKHTPLTKRPS
jgi:hypothetical protein